MEQLAEPQLVVDTDVIIDYLRGRTTILQTALMQYECAITAVTLYELEAVAVRSQRQQRLIELLLSMVDVLPFDRQAAHLAADIWRTLEAQGRGIGLPDTLLAGICLAHGSPLLTRNLDHFRRVPGLRVVASEELGEVDE